MVRPVPELLLTAVLTCQQANLIAARALLNDNIPTTVAAEVIEELRAVTIPECVLPVINKG